MSQAGRGTNEFRVSSNVHSTTAATELWEEAVREPGLKETSRRALERRCQTAEPHRNLRKRGVTDQLIPLKIICSRKAEWCLPREVLGCEAFDLLRFFPGIPLDQLGRSSSCKGDRSRPDEVAGREAEEGIVVREEASELEDLGVEEMASGGE
jgi:hypothetical protein